MKSCDVTAVVVTYNSSAVVSGALGSLKESFDAGVLAECLVVDNASADGTAERVVAEHGWCTVVRGRENLGFGRGCNVGIARAKTPYVLLLNPDATLTREGLERLADFLDRHPRAGAAAPAIQEPDGRLQPAGGLLTPRALLLEAFGLGDDERRTIQPGEAPFRTSWVCGAVVLLRRSMLEQLGGFDPRYFLYFEETDLWRRAQRAGWEIWAVGEAIATHLKSASARTAGRELYYGCLADHYFTSRFHYLAEHFGWSAAAAVELTELGVTLLRISLRRLRRRDLGELGARLRAPLLRRPLRYAP
jgi:N-acetylglucosaminyl-diphospho-decaprenol L-rhamnosyltransferase